MMSGTISTKDYVGIAIKYASDVVLGHQPASRLTAMSCQRMLDDLKRADEGWDYYLDHAAANRVCRFVEMFPHVKGAKGRLILLPWQVFVLVNIYSWLDEDGLRRYRTAYIEMPKKQGKAEDVDNLVLTPEGPRRIGDLVSGDLVIGGDGQIDSVLAAYPIEYGLECFEVSFATGEKVVCSGEHEWLVDSPYWRAGRRSVETEVLAENVKYSQGNRYDVAVAPAHELPERGLNIPPYTLGAWLGDGHSACARLTCADTEIVEAIRAEGVSVEKQRGHLLYLIGRGWFQKQLRSDGLLDNKHIPEDYLLSSKDQRLELLRGLMDTDGYASIKGECEFTSIRKILALSVFRLVNSLGIKARWREGRATLDGRDISAKYRVVFDPPNGVVPFRVHRKACRVESVGRKTQRSSKRKITDIQPVASRQVRCIEVSRGSYLTTLSGIPTCNSTFVSPLGIYGLCMDGEEGAEVYTAAVARKQAKIVWGMAKAMLRRTPKFVERYGVELLASAITHAPSDSTFQALSKEGKSLEGINPSLALVDELHRHQNREVWDILDESRDARDQSLMIAITNTGSDKSSICYEQRTYLKKILERKHDDESFFGIIYTIDPEDEENWDDPAVWAKAQPSLGHSVKLSGLQRKARKAKLMAGARSSFMRYQLGVWTSGEHAWLPANKWDGCRGVRTEEDLLGQRCYVGFDLASKVDLAAMVAVFLIDGMYVVLAKFYCPETRIKDNDSYLQWAADGYLVPTPGTTIDFALIEEDLLEWNEKFVIEGAPYDPAQANQFATRMTNAGIPMIEFAQNAMNYSEPMKEIERAVVREDGDGNHQPEFEHVKNEALDWMINNVVIQPDRKENVFPRKERPENKIDGPVAMIMGSAMWLKEKEEIPVSPWDNPDFSMNG